jgi:hypothetical protein
VQIRPILSARNALRGSSVCACESRLCCARIDSGSSPFDQQHARTRQRQDVAVNGRARRGNRASRPRMRRSRIRRTAAPPNDLGRSSSGAGRWTNRRPRRSSHAPRIATHQIKAQPGSRRGRSPKAPRATTLRGERSPDHVHPTGATTSDTSTRHRLSMRHSRIELAVWQLQFTCGMRRLRAARPVVVSDANASLASSRRAVTPGKPGLTSRAKGARFTTRRVMDP